MIYKLKRVLLDAKFSFYGLLCRWVLKLARKCAYEYLFGAADYWLKVSDKLIDKRQDILERLTT